MNLKNQPPIFVPIEYRAEIEKLSKAALMDMVWDYAMQCGPGAELPNAEAVMIEFRQRREIILSHREQAKGTVDVRRCARCGYRAYEHTGGPDLGCGPCAGFAPETVGA